jgi:pimeloyl-ACP methyl ester carboxylesterase
MVAALVLLVVLLAAIGWHLYIRSIADAAEMAVPRIGRMQRVRGGRIHHVDLGPRDAQTLVLIHGLGGQLQHFTHSLTPLLEDEYRLIVPDRPGCGYSERDSGDLAPLPDQARMMWELLDALEVKKPVLVGHSLGGALALAMALDRPADTGALALLCPATQPVGKPAKAFEGLDVPSPILRRAIAETVAVPAAKKTGAATLDAIFAPEPWPQDFPVRAGGVLGLRPKAFVTTSEDFMMMRPAMRAQAARYAAELKAPGGVLFGADDKVLSAEEHGPPMTAHGLEYETLEGRGHMIPITAPEDTADFIRRMAAKAA